MKHFRFLSLSLALLLMACSPNLPATAIDSGSQTLGPTANNTQNTESQNTAAESEGYTLYVHSETRDCVGVGPQTCLQVRKAPDAEWQLFYDQIEGFDYEAGYEYTLQVSESKIENPPADASSLRISLIQILQKTAVSSVENKLADTQWNYLGQQSNGVLIPALAGSQVNIQFTDQQSSGNAGCNRFSGGYSQDEERLSFASLAMTKRACVDPGLQQQEHVFIQALSEVSHWRIEKMHLYLKYTDEAELVFEAAEDLES